MFGLFFNFRLFLSVDALGVEAIRAYQFWRAFGGLGMGCPSILSCVSVFGLFTLILDCFVFWPVN